MRICLMLALVLMTGTIAEASDNGIQDSSIPHNKVILAREIDTKDENTPIIYNNVSIVGDLKLNHRKLKNVHIENSIINGNVSFEESTFTEGVEFINTSFQKEAQFFRTIFEKELDLNGTRFKETANFSEASFMGGATFDYINFNNDTVFSASSFRKFGSFYNSTFLGEADFYLAYFNGHFINFENTTFMKGADFAETQFLTYLTFMYARFGNYSDFRAAKIFGGANFNDSTFEDFANFDRCHFTESMRFKNIKFHGIADFSNTRFDGPSFFYGSRFYKNALFENAQFLGPSDFSNAQFDKDLFMNNSKISTMVFEGVTFNGKLYLSKADINRLMVKWSQIEDIIAYDDSAYLSLIKNYKDLGMSEANDCYYKYRTLNQAMKSWGWAKSIDVFGNITCGYGVKADRPIICSLILVLLCSTILWKGRGLRRASNIEMSASGYDSLYYSFAIFFTIPLPDFKPAGRYRYVPIFLRAISWTLFALLIATIGKIMIK